MSLKSTAVVAVLSFTLGLFLTGAEGCDESQGGTTPSAPKVTKTWTPGATPEKTWQPGPDPGVPIRKRGDVCSTVGAVAQDKEGVPLKCKKNPGESDARWRNNG